MDDTFNTRDLYLAAALVTKGFTRTGIDIQLEGSKQVGYWSFERTQELEAVEKDFWNGKLLVEPKAYNTAARGLKAEVSSLMNNPRNIR